MMASAFVAATHHAWMDWLCKHSLSELQSLHFHFNFPSELLLSTQFPHHTLHDASDNMIPSHVASSCRFTSSSLLLPLCHRLFIFYCARSLFPFPPRPLTFSWHPTLLCLISNWGARVCLARALSLHRTLIKSLHTYFALCPSFCVAAGE